MYSLGKISSRGYINTLLKLVGVHDWNFGLFLMRLDLCHMDKTPLCPGVFKIMHFVNNIKLD